MTKKKVVRILADENGKFCLEKVKFKKKIENRGKNLKQGGNASWPQGGGRPWLF